MHPERHRSQRRLSLPAIAGLGLAAIVASHLYLPPDLSPTATWFWHSFHAPGFALVTWAAVWTLKSRDFGSRSYWLAGAVALLAALIAEAAQMVGGRNAQVSDLVVDAIGIVGALGTALLLDRPLRQRLGAAGIVPVAVMSIYALFLAFHTSIRVGTALVERGSELPTLLSLEHGWESYLFPEIRKGTATVVSKPAGWPVAEGRFVLRAQASDPWDILIRLYPYPDWSLYRRFSFVAASADERSHRVSVSIIDSAGARNGRSNRYITTVEIGPEPERVFVTLAHAGQVASDRPFDLRRIDSVIVDTSAKDPPVTLLLDDFRLE